MTAGVRVPQGIYVPPRTATLVVAANDSTPLGKAQADYVCSGVDDHVDIQRALDALPASGGKVMLLDGTYNVSAQIDLDSYQTLSGQGKNTILKAVTLNMDILSLVGGAGTEKVHTTIKDLCIDGDDKASRGIALEYGDWSLISNVLFTNVKSYDVEITYCDHDTITACHFKSKNYSVYFNYTTYLLIENNNAELNNANAGFASGESSDEYCAIIGNVIHDITSTSDAITITGSKFTVSGNAIYGAYEGIVIWGAENSVMNNIIQSCGYGFYTWDSSRNIIVGNVVMDSKYDGMYLGGATEMVVAENIIYASSQAADVAFSNIVLDDIDNSLIANNICRDGGGDNQPAYGIDIKASSSKNILEGNDLEDSGKTGNLNDAGVLTHVEDSNRGIEITQIKHFRRVKNTSGAQRVVGEVVSLKAVAAGNEITAPAAVGERQVYGMVAETIPDDDWGLVQVKGFTTQLVATNMGGNIDIGDFLITTIGTKAQKAAADTDPIFARALEACAVVTCMIDAFIKSPWD